ncbi:MAG TPA: hypothetical protein VJL83_02925 [Patescibacteria group bacterium]|nr:hypothetical protein [Patescibacteria group bacterium]
MARNARRTNPFNVIFVGTAVVLFWRGAWGLLDLYLFPENPAVSFISSILLGLLILILTHHLVDELM